MKSRKVFCSTNIIWSKEPGGNYVSPSRVLLAFNYLIWSLCQSRTTFSGLVDNKYRLHTCPYPFLKPDTNTVADFQLKDLFDLAENQQYLVSLTHCKRKKPSITRWLKRLTTPAVDCSKIQLFEYSQENWTRVKTIDLKTKYDSITASNTCSALIVSNHQQIGCINPETFTEQWQLTTDHSYCFLHLKSNALWITEKSSPTEGSLLKVDIHSGEVIESNALPQYQEITWESFLPYSDDQKIILAGGNEKRDMIAFGHWDFKTNSFKPLGTDTITNHFPARTIDSAKGDREHCGYDLPSIPILRWINIDRSFIYVLGGATMACQSGAAVGILDLQQPEIFTEVIDEEDSISELIVTPDQRIITLSSEYLKLHELEDLLK